MKTKIHIHIFDDEKFADAAIKLFEEVTPGTSHYFVNKKKGLSFSFVKSNHVQTVDFGDIGDRNEFYKYLNSDSNHIIFLHALNHFKQEIILNTKQEIKKVWFIWGYDLYMNWPLLEKQLYLPATKLFLGTDIPFKTRLLRTSLAFFIYKNRWIIHILNKKSLQLLGETFETKFYKAAGLINFVVPVVPNEYEIIKKMKLKAQYAPFTYGCIEDLLGDKINETVIGKPNILIGNSADPSNNHLDVFIKLSKLNLKGRKIYVPLSYSGTDKYKNEVIRVGYELFKNNFYPLMDFMSINKYNEILLSCGIVVFNHIRQQAVGNIITMGYLGAKIYMNKKSPVYKFLKQEGITISEISDLATTHLDRPMSPVAMIENKKIFYNLYSRASVHSKIETLLQLIRNKK
ncbi:MAG: TDP-N-acetylfucosamine:lipid II N-acetylfucosaminyltransferase [Weeksellaceae bacterium]|nr:TDP-N-acetylfucosamine:lipid II N-acetylfucosaminyltransferase [Weeksellaceae bacterium]